MTKGTPIGVPEVKGATSVTGESESTLFSDVVLDRQHLGGSVLDG